MKQACVDVGYVHERIALASLLLLDLALGGCTTSTAGSSLLDARAEAPGPPKAPAYLPVGDLPPAREKPAMTVDERAKVLKELIAARDRQASRVKAREGETRSKPVTP